MRLYPLHLTHDDFWQRTIRRALSIKRLTHGLRRHYILGVRTVFILLVLANIAAFALGQGWFGVPRSQAGRTPADRQQALVNPDAVRVAPGQLQNR